MNLVQRLPAGDWRGVGDQRVPGAAPEQLGWVGRLVLRLIRRRTRAASDYNVFLVFARLGSIFPAHAVFLSQILLRGRLSQTEKELTILRVAWRMGCGYEWGHHAHMAADLGVPAAEVAAMADPTPRTPANRRDALVAIADELLASHTLSDPSWQAAGAWLNDDELLEACMVVGHYAMVAMTLNATRVQLEDEFIPAPPASGTATQRVSA
ncbi:carboxymuconolactone decarboxylase family protein [Streptomyces sp. NBC_01589]|uniref:carboxymuconolactone decarboxylase family protein n=1 Tax=Streptomyces sp. NBC_01589 TaxID=2975886 RepID=UPI00386BB857